MNYERKYKEALEWMRSVYNGLQGATKEDAEHYFPELQESEDERIRKDIIRVFKGEIKFISEKENERYIAWLEKQGKPKDKG